MLAWLSAASVRAFAPWTDALAQEIFRRRPGAPRAVCQAVATAYREAAHAALLQWAETGAHDSPARAVDATLRWLDLDISLPEVIT